MAKLVTFARPFFLQPLRLYRPNNLFRRRKFFLCFADAFLFLLDYYRLTGKNEQALLPDFYCPDTLKMISRHFKVSFYRTNDDFSIDQESYFSQLKKIKPRLIINYSFLGSALTEEKKKHLAGLIAEDTIIIEDYAHRLVDFSDWQPVNRHHYIIDSLRKHSPLLGSHLIGGAMAKAKGRRLNFYKIQCHLLQLVKGLAQYLSVIFNSGKLYDLSENLFFWQDGIIGNYSKATLGSLGSFYFYNFIDSVKLKARRRRTIQSYQAHFKKLGSPLVRILPDEIAARAELNYYPLFVDQSIQENLALYLKSKNIYLERLWEPEGEYNRQLNVDLMESFLILPNTYLVTEDDIARIFREIDNFLKK